MMYGVSAWVGDHVWWGLGEPFNDPVAAMISVVWLRQGAVVTVAPILPPSARPSSEVVVQQLAGSRGHNSAVPGAGVGLFAS